LSTAETLDLSLESIYNAQGRERLNESKDHAIHTWVKGSGEIVAIHLKSKVDDKGQRTWCVDGKADIIK
jgi:hypothetical protein